MPDSITIFFAGGGTGGHLYPGLAVADAVVAARPGTRCVFLCTTREIDQVILDPTGYERVPQPIVPPVKSIGGLLRFWNRWRETKELVRKRMKADAPAAVVGLGGYAAGVAVKLAAEAGIPTAILNPDVLPGKANQYLMRYARAVCCQFEQTAKHVPAEHAAKIRLTGCPIRREVVDLPTREAAAARLGLDPLLRTLVVTGASLGAKTVNEAVLTMLADLTLNGWQILHLAGRDHADAVRAGYRDLPTMTRVARVIDFTPAMGDVWAVADLAVSRSGASSCAELTACGVPSALMPYPFHKDMHQRANAEALVEKNAAVLVEDEKDRHINAKKLRAVIEPLLYGATNRTEMAQAARAMGRPDAAQAAARVVTDLIDKPVK